MGSRYYITGTQIGIIYAMLDLAKPEDIRKLLQEVLDNQFIGNAEEFKKMRGKK